LAGRDGIHQRGELRRGMRRQRALARPRDGGGIGTPATWSPARRWLRRGGGGARAAAGRGGAARGGAVRVPDPWPAAAREHAVGLRFGDVVLVRRACRLVALLDQQPLRLGLVLPHPHQGPAALQLLALELELEAS